MQDEANPIPRLDRSKPPTGYEARVVVFDDGQAWLCAPSGGGISYRGDTQQEAASEPWDRYEGKHDPPGMSTRWEPDDRCRDSLEVGEWHVEVDIGGPAMLVWHEHYDNQGDVKREGVWMSSAEWARRVAWKWYWRRVGIVGRLDAMAAARKYLSCVGVFEPGDLWPAMLTWSDEHVAAIEALLCGEVAVAP